MTGEWRADPFGRHEYRYWDGSAWSEHVSDHGAVSGDPVGADEVSPPPPPMPSGPYLPPASGAPAYYYGPPVRTNGLAIASMVLGIVWVYWIGSILAVIFGHVSLRQIRRAQGAQRGRGMAIAGLVLGYVGIASLIALIVVLLTVDIDFGPSTAECRADARIVVAAEESYHSEHGVYGTEADLVRDGWLTDESDHHDVLLIDGGEHYELLASGECS
jgi:hypothetical protein